MTALAAGSLITDVAARLSGEIFEDKDVQRFRFLKSIIIFYINHTFISQS